MSKRVVTLTGSPEQAAQAGAAVSKELQDLGHSINGDLEILYYENIRTYKITIYYDEGEKDAVHQVRS
jgi:hypothetical protein